MTTALGAVFLFGCATETAVPITPPVVLVAPPVAAQQQTMCGDRTAILAALAARYGEHPRNWGMTPRGTVIELLVSESGSWTMLVSQTNGISCVIAVGENWVDVSMPARGTVL